MTKVLSTLGTAIKYIGMRAVWPDHLYDTGLTFEKGQVRTMPSHIANKFLRHIDMFELAKEEEATDDQETLQAIDAATHKADEIEQNNTREYDMIDQINNMSRDGMIEHAEKHYQVKLKGHESTIRKELTNLVNRFGVL